MRKPASKWEEKPLAPVAEVGVRAFRAQLPLFLNGNQPVRVVNHGRNVGFYLPCGTSDYSDRWDWAKQRRTLRAHFEAALKSFPDD